MVPTADYARQGSRVKCRRERAASAAGKIHEPQGATVSALRLLPKPEVEQRSGLTVTNAWRDRERGLPPPLMHCQGRRAANRRKCGLRHGRLVYATLVKAQYRTRPC